MKWVSSPNLHVQSQTGGRHGQGHCLCVLCQFSQPHTASCAQENGDWYHQSDSLQLKYIYKESIYQQTDTCLVQLYFDQLIQSLVYQNKVGGISNPNMNRF